MMEITGLKLPSDWSLCRISDAYCFTKKPRGFNLKRNGVVIPFFTMAQIPIGKIRVSEFTPKPVDKLGSGTYVENGDVMVAKITPSFENGKQAIVDIETGFAYATTEVIPLRGIAEKADNLFLFFFLLHPEVRSDLAGKMEGSTGRQRLSKTVLGEQRIPLPPLPEQKKIAYVLSTVQQAIEQQERIIATTTELKKALMQKLFTEGLRGEPQKQTEIGPVPESWEAVWIKTTGTVVTGSTPSTKNPDYYGGNFNLISPADLDNEKYVRSAHKTLTRAGFEKCRKVPRDSVLVGCIGNVGKLGMVADDCSTTNQQINSIIPNSEFSPHFLYYALQLCRPRLEQAAAKVTLPILNKSNFENFQIAAPHHQEQEAIAGYLGVLDRKIEKAGQKAAQLQDLFRTLLHELMTASIRVDGLEFEIEN